MKPSILNSLLFIVGLAIVVACIVLFVQCGQIAESNLKSENLFAQAVLDDVLRSLLHKYPNGIKPTELRWELYSRVSIYTAIGFALISAAAFRHCSHRASHHEDTTPDQTSDS